MGEIDRGWDCIDPAGLLNNAFQEGEAEQAHELLMPEPHPQFDPGVLEVGGLVPSVNHGAGQRP